MKRTFKKELLAHATLAVCSSLLLAVMVIAG